MSDTRILIAGIGNIFLGDDAFGVELTRRLANYALPESVRLIDFGIRGLDLAYEILNGYDAVILLDATQRGGAPGTLYLIEPENDPTPADEASPLVMHELDPANVLQLVRSLGSAATRVLLVGCEPEPLADDADPPPSLSPAVAAALDEAVELTLACVAHLIDHQPLTPGPRVAAASLKP